ncbi:MAG: glycerophosphodiester phosphodiesterase [Candidatus Thalassarchaeaceae archaeon]
MSFITLSDNMVGGAWKKPRENSIEALLYGIEHADGVEMDLRLTADGEVVIHHDPRTSGGLYPESSDYSEIAEYSDRFEDLLSKEEFTSRWVDEGRFVCLELKAPHPSSGAGGGWFRGDAMRRHMSDLMQKVREMIEHESVPISSTVFYSFDPVITKVAKRHSGDYRHARLMPKLRQWGGWKVQRAAAFPSFISTSVPRMLSRQRRLGAPMLPLALDYLEGWTRHIPIGVSVGLKGRGLERFNEIRKGHPVYVWPAPLDVEPRLLDAGLSCISDTMDSNLQYPGGLDRCMRPATMPEIEGVRMPWNEISSEERRGVVQKWRKRWSWSATPQELEKISTASTLPWEAPRLIGHRGVGKDPGTL